VLRLLGNIIGIVTTMSVRILAILVIKKLFTEDGFYQTYPTLTRLVDVSLEFWNLALTIMYMVVRLSQLIIIGILYIGRIDTPLVAQGAGDIGPIHLDANSEYFKLDLLQHEAHRHPYIERLGLMYLMKLRHGQKFGNRINTYWRMTFVLLLMPWLQNYRTWAYSDTQNDNHEKYGDDEEDSCVILKTRPKNKPRTYKYQRMMAMTKQPAALHLARTSLSQKHLAQTALSQKLLAQTALSQKLLIGKTRFEDINSPEL